MLTDKLRPFYEHLHEALATHGANAPAIADEIVTKAFPDTAEAADREGADRMLREGVKTFVTKYLKRTSSEPDVGQIDMAALCETFKPIIGRLSSVAHYVPSLQAHVAVGALVADPGLLDEARKFKRLKGEETIAEADVLDELYFAVMEAVAAD